MKRYIVHAPIHFYVSAETPEEARRRLTAIILGLNRVLSSSEGITFPPKEKIENLKVEEISF